MKQYDLTDPPASKPSATAATATDPQVNYLRDLLRDRQVSEQTNAAISERLDAGTMPRRAASTMIDHLKQRPKIERTAEIVYTSQDWPEVPAGRYALREWKHDHWSAVKFYKVDRPTEGKWAGYVFLSVGAGGPYNDPDWHPIKASAPKRAIMNRILEDVTAALRLYGQEIGECGHCGRTLTDEESRAYGVGPVCRRKLGIG